MTVKTIVEFYRDEVIAMISSRLPDDLKNKEITYFTLDGDDVLTVELNDKKEVPF